MKEITIDIHKDGTIQIEGSGFKGSECKIATSELEAALGKVQSTELKPEYRQGRTTQNKIAR